MTITPLTFALQNGDQTTEESTKTPVNSMKKNAGDTKTTESTSAPESDAKTKKRNSKRPPLHPDVRGKKIRPAFVKLQKQLTIEKEKLNTILMSKKSSREKILAFTDYRKFIQNLISNEVTKNISDNEVAITMSWIMEDEAFKNIRFEDFELESKWCENRRSELMVNFNPQASTIDELPDNIKWIVQSLETLCRAKDAK